MKQKRILSIFIMMALCAGAAVTASGCSSRVYSNNPNAVVSDSAAESSAAESSEAESSEAESSDAESSDAESSEAESSEAESSDAESSDAESSEAESSDAESSEAESSDTESSDAESSEAESSDTESSDAENGDAKTATITFEKPDEWGDTVKIKPYMEGNLSTESYEMTNNGDGTYSYTVEYEDPDKNMLVIFVDPEHPRYQYPKTSGLIVEDGKTYQVES